LFHFGAPAASSGAAGLFGGLGGIGGSGAAAPAPGGALFGGTYTPGLFGGTAPPRSRIKVFGPSTSPRFIKLDLSLQGEQSMPPEQEQLLKSFMLQSVHLDVSLNEFARRSTVTPSPKATPLPSSSTPRMTCSCGASEVFPAAPLSLLSPTSWGL
jgi:hypothetical protein